MADIDVIRTSNDLRIRHFKALQVVTELDENSQDSRLEWLGVFLGLKLHELRLLTAKQIATIYYNSVKVVSEMKINPTPPTELVLNGKVFTRIDPNKVGIGWHIDIGDAGRLNLIEKNPVKLACLFYYPEGSIYGELDENDNLIHPISEREELFKEHFPLNVFVESTAFFLNYYVKSIRKSIIQELAKRQTLRVVNRLKSMFGKRQST